MKPIAIVAGAMAAKAGKGGHAWSRISFVAGLKRLGFQVLFLEQLRQPRPEQRAYFEQVCAEFEIEGSLVGSAPSYDLIARAEVATLLLNIGGNLTEPELKRPVDVRVYVDDDPGYTQFWHEAGLVSERLAGHDHYFTFGTNIGQPGCSLPTCGIDWKPLAPPVVLDQWPVADGVRDGFTTVASWRGAYGRVEANGHLFGQKAHEFRRFIETPRHAGQRFEIALDIEQADLVDADHLQSHGWCLVDPSRVAASPDDFRGYVQLSGAEFSVAQGIYVETGCGWFSDRTTRYLASGKPVLIQDTGFSKRFSTGEGVIAFATLDEAVSGAVEIAHHYDVHAAAARAVAERNFDSDLVLGGLLEAVGL